MTHQKCLVLQAQQSSLLSTMASSSHLFDSIDEVVHTQEKLVPADDLFYFDFDRTQVKK